MEYCRDLGYCAANFLIHGGNAAVASILDGRFTPIPFDEILDPQTSRTRVRMVDVKSESYHIAREFMIRLGPEDVGGSRPVGSRHSPFSKVASSGLGRPEGA